MNKNKILIASLIAGALLSPAAFAQTTSGVFVRGDVGRANIKDGGNDTSYGIRGGYYITPNFGVELGYVNLYNESNRRVTLPGTTAVGRESAKFSAMTLGITGKYNFSGAAHEGFYIGGRAGISRGKYTGSVSNPAFGTTPAFSQSFNSTSTAPYVGVSAGYDFSPNMGVSLSYDHYRGKTGASNGEKFNVNNVNLGFEYRF